MLIIGIAGYVDGEKTDLFKKNKKYELLQQEKKCNFDEKTK